MLTVLHFKMKPFWKQCLIAIVIVTLGAAYIHQKFNFPPNWDAFLIWIPVAWVLVLSFALMFSLLLNLGEKD